MDLRCRKGKTYSDRSVAEGRCHSLDRFRLMQRPKSTETKMHCGGGDEARVIDGGERNKTKKGKNEEDLVGSIYKEGPLKEREK